MAWDSSRPVPWTRLMREWVIYALIMSVIFALFFRDGGMIGAIAGLLVSGPLYLGLGFILAKFGYQRQTIKQMRAQRQNPKAGSGSASGDAVPAGPRPRPAPTRRTTSGPSNRPKSKKRR